MILSMFGIFFILPYQAAFDMYREVHGWTLTKNFFIGLYIVDIVVNFRTGYVQTVEITGFSLILSFFLFQILRQDSANGAT